jgi:putative transposase
MTHPDHFSEQHPAVEALLANGGDGLAQVLQLLFNEAMKIERSRALQANPYERSEVRQGHANGFKPKSVTSRVGKLELQVPQTRGFEFYPSCIEKGLRSERALNLAIAQMYIQGVSTRKVDSIVQQLCGEGVSRERVSQLTQLLDEELERWRQRELGRALYMVLDARYESTRIDGLVRSCALLIAYGITNDGKRMVLGTSVSLSEAEAHWRMFFRSLKDRGLRGLECITSDDHSGLKAAIKTEFPGVLWQRCQVHLQRNAAAYVPRLEMRKEVAGDLRSIFNATDLEDAQYRLKTVVEKYRTKAAKLSSWMEDNIPEGMTVFNLPASHRVKMRTSNWAERTNKELKRRTRVIEIFPDEASLLRISSAILREFSEAWEVGKTYLNLEADK